MKQSHVNSTKDVIFAPYPGDWTVIKGALLVITASLKLELQSECKENFLKIATDCNFFFKFCVIYL